MSVKEGEKTKKRKEETVKAINEALDEEAEELYFFYVKNDK